MFFFGLTNIFFISIQEGLLCNRPPSKRMVSSHSRSSGKQEGKSVASSASKSSKPTINNKQVQVIACPSAFPISTKTAAERKRPRDDSADSQKNNAFQSKGRFGKNKRDKSLLDWHDTVKEIRSYGATAFEGKQKRDYQDEQYFNLTGRHKKKPQTPLPIVRGIKKAAAKREAKAREEARQAGIILPKAKREKKKADNSYENYGPAPSIGFVKKGVFRFQNKNEK